MAVILFLQLLFVDRCPSFEIGTSSTWFSPRSTENIRIVVSTVGHGFRNLDRKMAFMRLTC